MGARWFGYCCDVELAAVEAAALPGMHALDCIALHACGCQHVTGSKQQAAKAPSYASFIFRFFVFCCCFPPGFRWDSGGGGGLATFWRRRHKGRGIYFRPV